MRNSLVIIGITILIAIIVGWATLNWGKRDDRFVRPDSPKPSPSGSFNAFVELGPTQNGVKTWIAVIRNKAGAEVFRDNYPYSTRHRLWLTWLSGKDQLWIYSGDVGPAYVDQRPGGTGIWSKTEITPEITAEIPEEMRQLMPGRKRR